MTKQGKLSEPMRNALVELYCLGGQATVFPGKGTTADALEKRGLIAWSDNGLKGNEYEAKVFLTERGSDVVSDYTTATDRKVADAAPVDTWADYLVEKALRLPAGPWCEECGKPKSAACDSHPVRPTADDVETVETGGRYFLRCSICQDETLYLYPADDVDASKVRFAANHPCAPIPTAADVTRMTGDPVGWFEGLSTPVAVKPKHKVGDRLYFRPSSSRAPFGTVISEGEVLVTEVVDHESATEWSPRFTYVVRALNPSRIIKGGLGLGGLQGTDERELSSIPKRLPRKVKKSLGLQRGRHGRKAVSRG